MKKLLGILFIVASSVKADLPKYYGYDWIDPWPNDVMVAYNSIKDHTNLNVVHSITSLNSSACSNNNCVLSISAGQSSVYTDICPDTSTDATCSSVAYVNIWNIISSVKKATNKPSAIYFIDEPFFEAALKDQNNVYVPYRYSSYVCTMNDAMTAYNIKLPIFTILSDNQYKTQAYKEELTNGMPATGCPTTVKSTLDWIGIDNYTWTTSQQIISAYSSFDPVGKWKWVMVVPSSYDVATEAQIAAFYKEAAEINNNFVYVMNFKYDGRMFGSGKQSELKSKSFGMFIKNLHK